MRKFYALEEDEPRHDNNLLIDKLITKKEEESDPLSLTAELMKQRIEINKKVEEELETNEEDSEESEEPEENSEEGEEDNEDNTSSEEPTEPTTENEDDVSEAADDPDDLDNLVGSGLKESKEATESLKEKPVKAISKRKLTTSNIFNPLKDAHAAYRESMSVFSLETLKATEQPVAYVKEAVLESLSNLLRLAHNYIESNRDFIDTISSSTKEINERISVFQTLVENEQYHFTHKLVNDKEVLRIIGYQGTADLRKTIKALNEYLEDSFDSVTQVLNNKFDLLKDSFASNSFIEDGDDLVYNKPIPGFNVVRIGLTPYIDYMKTDPSNYHYYKITGAKTEDLYDLPSVSITEDRDIVYIVENLGKLVTKLGVSIDLLSKVNEHFTKFVDELKVIHFNVSENEYTQLTELGIDEKLKDFIKFKMAIEVININVDLVINYITSASTAINVMIELKE